MQNYLDDDDRVAEGSAAVDEQNDPAWIPAAGVEKIVDEEEQLDEEADVLDEESDDEDGEDEDSEPDFDAEDDEDE